MRELKDFRFRLWDGEKMRHPLIDSDGDQMARCEDLNDTMDIFFKEPKPPFSSGYIFYRGLVMMQWIGQHDKNGREIYEGDIVRLFMREYVALGVIQWFPQQLRFAFREHGDGIFGFHDDAMFEIIGNIYENPELLEVRHE